jgi:hypothetical protein
LFAYRIDGFAQAYKEWCRNFRHRKDLYWMYEVEPEFDAYQYLGKNIIKEIEFAYLYCQRKGKGKNVKGLQYVLRDYIGNHEENYNILKEYVHLIEDGHEGVNLFDGNINFELVDSDLQSYLENGANFVRTSLERCDENRVERRFLIYESGGLKPWTPFQNKQPQIGEVSQPELNKIIAANILNIHLILNTATAEEKEHKKINWEKVISTGMQIGEMIIDNRAIIKNVIKGGIALNNQYKAYSNDGTTELVNASPVLEDKSLWGFVKGVAGAAVNNFLNTPDPPKKSASGENFSNTTNYQSKVTIEEITDEQAAEIERQNQNKHAIVKSSNNTEIVKSNNNSQSNDIKERIRERNKQKQKKDNDNLNN